MYRHLPSYPARVVCCGVFACLCISCGKRGHERYIPKVETARQSLEAGLKAWQEGKAVGKVAMVSPPVQVVDSQWQGGRKLQRYEILSEDLADGPPWFTVRLTLDQPNGEQEVRYVVIGIDPIWVYREDDYAKITQHLEHGSSHH